MAWYNSLKDLGGDISSGAKAVGHTVGSLASNPLVDGALGLVTGGLAVPVLAGLGGGLLKPGGNIGQGLIGGAEGLAAGGAGKAIGGALGVGGAAGSAGAAGGSAGATTAPTGLAGLLGKIPGVTGAEQLLGGRGGSGGGTSGAPSGLASLLGGAGQWLTGNGGANALGAAEGVNAALLGQQSTNYAKQAANAVNDSYNARAPLRLAGVNGMLNATRGNPFSTGATGAPNTMAATPIRSVVAGQGVTL